MQSDFSPPARRRKGLWAVRCRDKSGTRVSGSTLSKRRLHQDQSFKRSTGHRACPSTSIHRLHPLSGRRCSILCHVRTSPISVRLLASDASYVAARTKETSRFQTPGFQAPDAVSFISFVDDGTASLQTPLLLQIAGPDLSGQKSDVDVRPCKPRRCFWRVLHKPPPRGCLPTAKRTPGRALQLGSDCLGVAENRLPPGRSSYLTGSRTVQARRAWGARHPGFRQLGRSECGDAACRSSRNCALVQCFCV